ncbi:unnamed protein product [Rhodiola kirilowii]
MAASVTLKSSASFSVRFGVFFWQPSVCQLSRLTCSYSTVKRKESGGAGNGGLRKGKDKSKGKISVIAASSRAVEDESLREKLKRRTRSEKEFDINRVIQYGDVRSHVPVMLGEVMEVFSQSAHFPSLRSFVDCTIGAAGHSTAIIEGHPELRMYVGMDVDPAAHERAQMRIKALLNDDLKTFTVLKNFRYIKPVLAEIDDAILTAGVDGILMDLGISSMQVDNVQRGFSVMGDGPLDMRMDPQASLKAEDILNSWPDTEVGRILRDYGEESNWRSLQKKIIKARESGGLHSTSELVDLIRGSTAWAKGGRQGWIKTATRVFQALRIAVNDELKVLEDALYACFDCLAPGGRLAVISFHSLEDRIVKQTFLDIINNPSKEDSRLTSEAGCGNSRNKKNDNVEKESWVKQMVLGQYGSILTKRPITPTEEEEEVNKRSRSAKLRVIQKH